MEQNKGFLKKRGQCDIALYLSPFLLDQAMHLTWINTINIVG